MRAERYTDEEIAAIRDLQRLAYDCVEAVAAELTPGVTEKEAAHRLEVVLRARGAEGFFHTPFAWFGDRAGFCGFRRPAWRRPLDNIRFARQFFPTERRLEPGMTGILDVAPIRGGLCADIGYAFAHGHEPRLDAAMTFLYELRGHILALVNAERTMRDIYQAVDTAIADAGYETAHVLYPSSVLGHKIGRIPLPRLGSVAFAGFDLRTYLYFGRQLVGSMPLWNRAGRADVRPEPGLWAIEPHIRRDGIGAKWEEILVVTEAGARWLDDDLPHVRGRSASARSAS